MSMMNHYEQNQENEGQIRPMGTARKFSANLGTAINESSTRGIKKAN